MRLRNHTEAPIMLQARINAGKKVKVLDGNNNEVTKPEPPQYTLICIPAESECEIDDKLWLQATSGKTRVQVFDEVKEVIPGAKMDKQPVYQTVLVPTGKFKDINLIEERIKKGDLTITVKVESNVPMADKIKALGLKKVVVAANTHTAEEIDTLYSNLCE